MSLLAFVVPFLLIAAGYAHFQIPRLTAGRSKAAMTHSSLIAVALVFGYVIAANASLIGQGASPLLVFLAGFGAVHVPAAIILFLKRRRGERKS